MIRFIQAIELPCKSVRAVAVENQDGSFTIYTNSLLPAEEQAEAAAELARRKEIQS